MFEGQILIPVADNDGDVFTTEEHGVFEAQAVEFFGGFTLYPANAIGGWLGPNGELMLDRTRVYAVAIATIADGGKFVALARFAKALYRQEAIYIRYLGLSEIIT